MDSTLRTYSSSLVISIYKKHPQVMVIHIITWHLRTQTIENWSVEIYTKQLPGHMYI